MVKVVVHIAKVVVCLKLGFLLEVFDEKRIAVGFFNQTIHGFKGL